MGLWDKIKKIIPIEEDIDLTSFEMTRKTMYDAYNRYINSADERGKALFNTLKSRYVFDNKFDEKTIEEVVEEYPGIDKLTEFVYLFDSLEEWYNSLVDVYGMYTTHDLIWAVRKSSAYIKHNDISCESFIQFYIMHVPDKFVITYEELGRMIFTKICRRGEEDKIDVLFDEINKYTEISKKQYLQEIYMLFIFLVYQVSFYNFGRNSNTAMKVRSGYCMGYYMALETAGISKAVINDIPIKLFERINEYTDLANEFLDDITKTVEPICISAVKNMCGLKVPSIEIVQIAKDLYIERVDKVKYLIEKNEVIGFNKK